jgi:translation initiation factor IF-2
MSKIRVYELAQKMGIDNKELIARLQAIGIEVKSHTASIDEADAKRLEAPATTSPAATRDVAKEEVRVTSTVIRRRAKVVEQPVEEPKADAVSVKPLEEQQPVTELPLKAELPSEPAKVEGEKESKVSQPTPAKEPPLLKPTANRAVILGRVEIPGMKTKEAPSDRRDTIRSAGKTPERGTARPAERPSPSRPERPGGSPPSPQAPAAVDDRKAKKRVEVEITPAAAPGGDRGKPGGKKPGDRKKEVFRKADLAEKRERVFEPGPKTGKGKKKGQYKERASDGKKTEITVPKAIKRIIKISESISVGELAKRMGVKATDLIRTLMKQGMMVTINHPLDVDTATILAADFGYEIENVAIDLEEIIESTPDTPESLEKRPPVVTIMWQDLASRCNPRGQCHCRRGGWHHPAHRRL